MPFINTVLFTTDADGVRVGSAGQNCVIQWAAGVYATVESSGSYQTVSVFAAGPVRVMSGTSAVAGPAVPTGNSGLSFTGTALTSITYDAGTDRWIVTLDAGGGGYPALSGLATGAVLRATSATSAAFGAVDLADSDAVTGLLPGANMTAATATVKGAVPTPPNDATKVLRGDMTYAVIPVYPVVPQARLTLTSGSPVMTADVATATTIYYAPYNGNRVDMYSGTLWVSYGITELSLAIGTLTSGKNYDVFVYANSGTPTLELSAAWASDTTRTNAIAFQDGVAVKSGATTRRLVGTIRTVSTTQTSFVTVTSNAGGANPAVFVANYYNRVLAACSRVDTTTTASNYVLATYRQARASGSNRIEYVQSNTDLTVRATVLQAVSLAAGVGDPTVGVGLDSTTVNSAQQYGEGRTLGLGALHATALYTSQNGTTQLGYHALNWLESLGAPGSVPTCNWYYIPAGDTIQSGMQAEIWY